MAKMTATITVDDKTFNEARYQAMSLSIRMDGVVDLLSSDGELLARFDKGDLVPDANLIKTEPEIVARKLVDAARVLMYGDGDLNTQVNDLAQAVAEYDKVEPSSEHNRLLQVIRSLHKMLYTVFSTEEWRNWGW